MKVTFLYDDIEHATPLLQSRDALAALGIDLHAEETHSAESVVCLVDRGADALIIHSTIMSDDALDQGRPIVVLDRIDGAQLGAGRKWLPSVDAKGVSQPSAAAIVKGYTYAESGRHNGHRGRYHTHLLKAGGVAATSPEQSAAIPGLPSPQLSTADLCKIKKGYGFGAYAKMAEPRKQLVDFSSEREYDVHFVGYMDYKGSEVESHRRLALAQAERWEEKHPERACCGAGRKFQHSLYLHSMLVSKCVLSPWGWGEACHRDYEAMLLGAVVVKPSMDHVACWPDVYRPNETYVPCRLDFGDVGEIVSRVIDEWPQWRERRELARKLAMEAGEPRRIARRFADILKEVT